MLFTPKDKTNQPDQSGINQRIIEAAKTIVKNLGREGTTYADDILYIEYSPSRGSGTNHLSESVEIWPSTVYDSPMGYFFEKTGRPIFHYQFGRIFSSTTQVQDGWVHHLLHVVYAGYINGTPYKMSDDL